MSLSRRASLSSVSLVWILLTLLTPGIHARTTICDEAMARDYCDRTPLLKMEGIWEFPDDGTRVLVRRASPQSRICDIVVLSTPDCRIVPGETIGEISPVADKNKFRLSLCRKRSKGILTDPAHCVASLSDNGNTLTVTPRKINISLGSMWLLPKFWRMFRIKLSDPERELHDGMIRIYPRQTPSSNSEPIYL